MVDMVWGILPWVVSPLPVSVAGGFEGRETLSFDPCEGVGRGEGGGGEEALATELVWDASCLTLELEPVEVLFALSLLVGATSVWRWGEPCCFKVLWEWGVFEEEADSLGTVWLPGVGSEVSTLFGEVCFSNLESSDSCSCVGCVDEAAGVRVLLCEGGFCSGMESL